METSTLSRRTEVAVGDRVVGTVGSGAISTAAVRCALRAGAIAGPEADLRAVLVRGRWSVERRS